jgi:hypothetical protein
VPTTAKVFALNVWPSLTKIQPPLKVIRDLWPSVTRPLTLIPGTGVMAVVTRYWTSSEGLWSLLHPKRVEGSAKVMLSPLP